MTPEQSEIAMRDEIAFVKQRIANARQLLKTTTDSNTVISRQMTATDACTSRSTVDSHHAKVTAANYGMFYGQVIKCDDTAKVDDSILYGVYRYQIACIEKLQKKLNAKDENRKLADRDLKDLMKQAEKIEAADRELTKSQEKTKLRYIQMWQDELDMKNKATYMNIDVRDESQIDDNNAQNKNTDERPRLPKPLKEGNSLGSSKIRKSTAKLKPMSMPIDS